MSWTVFFTAYAELPVYALIMYVTEECQWAMLTAYVGDDMAELVKDEPKTFLSQIFYCWGEQCWGTRDTPLI